MPTNVDRVVGQQLRQARLRKGWSQQQLADRLGVSYQQVQKYEKAMSKVPPARLWTLCSVFAVPITYFFEGLTSEDGTREAVDPQVSVSSARLAAKIERIQDKVLKRHILALVDTITDQDDRKAG